MIDNNQDALDTLADAWDSPVVARSDIKQFTGGLLSPKRMANLDCQGAGPPGRFRLGHRVAYVKDDLVKWLRTRAQGPGIRSRETYHPNKETRI